MSPKPAYLVIADELRARIYGGEPAAGEELPSIAKLASASGVSKAVARDALTWLVENDYATVRHGERFRVAATLPPKTDDREWTERHFDLEQRLAELERLLADAPTREEVDELKQRIDVLYRSASIDESASSATPSRRRRSVG